MPAENTIGATLCDRLRNNTIRPRCKNQPTVEVIQKRLLQWFSQLCQMNERCLFYRLLWWQRPAKWKVQLMVPKITWAKQIEADLKKNNDLAFLMRKFQNYIFISHQSDVWSKFARCFRLCFYVWTISIAIFTDSFLNQYLKVIINQILLDLDADWSMLQLC